MPGFYAVNIVFEGTSKKNRQTLAWAILKLPGWSRTDRGYMGNKL